MSGWIAQWEELLLLDPEQKNRAFPGKFILVMTRGVTRQSSSEVNFATWWPGVHGSRNQGRDGGAKRRS